MLVPILLVVGYPLSFVPACWIAGWSKSSTSCQVVSLLYAPIAESVIVGPEWYGSAMRWSIQSGLPNGVTLMDEPRGIVLQFPFQGFAYTILYLR